MQSPRSAIISAVRDTRRAFVRDLLARSSAEIGASDLTLSQLAALMILSDGVPRTINEIARHLGRSLSATSRLLDRLVQRELLARGEDPRDRRARRVELSKRGHGLVDGMLNRRAQAQLNLMKRLSPAERKVVERGLQLLARAARGDSDG